MERLATTNLKEEAELVAKRGECCRGEERKNDSVKFLDNKSTTFTLYNFAFSECRPSPGKKCSTIRNGFKFWQMRE